jgi:hypothetical protein
MGCKKKAFLIPNKWKIAKFVKNFSLIGSYRLD